MDKKLVIGGAVGAAAGFAIAKLCKAGKTPLIITVIAVAAAGAFVGTKM